MLNTQKIKWMTKAAIYEQQEEKAAFRVNRYFKGDYICAGMIRTAIGVAASALLLAIVWIVMNLERLLQESVYEELVAITMRILFYTGTAVIIGICIAFFVYLLRYRKMQKNMKEYVSYLKKIKKINDQERRNAGLDQEDEELW